MRALLVVLCAAGLMTAGAAPAEPGQGAGRGHVAGVVGKGEVAGQASSGEGRQAGAGPDGPAQAKGSGRGLVVGDGGVARKQGRRGTQAPTVDPHAIGVNEPGVNRAAAGSPSRTAEADPTAPF